MSKYHKRKIKLVALVGDDAAVAELVIDGVDFMGNSKRHPDDEFRYDIGESLAIARALRDAAEWYEQKADAASKIKVWRPFAGMSIPSVPVDGTYYLSGYSE